MLKKKRHILYGLILLGGLSLSFACKSRRAMAAQDASKGDNPVQSDSQKEISFGFLYVNGCTERMKGNLQQALSLFRECKKIDPQSAAASYELATIYKLLDSNSVALRHARFCAEADPLNEWYQLILIDCYNTGKQYNQSIKVRENLVKNFPDKSEYKEDLAIEYAMLGQYDRSFKIYEQLEKSYGINEQITLNKVKLLKSQHKRKEVEEELLKLSGTNKNESRYYSYLAEFYEEQNQAERAREMYDKILAVDPNNPTVNLHLHDYYRVRGENEQANKFLTRAFENPELEAGTKADILKGYYDKARQGDKKAAETGLALANVMLLVHPGTTESNSIYADFLRLEKKLPEAAKYYYLASLTEKRNYLVWKNLMFAYNDLQRFDSLEHHSASCMELFPSLPEGYLFNGLSNIQLKNFKKGVQSLNDGLDFVTGNRAYMLDFLRLLGDGYHHLKDYAKSDKAFDDALKIDADNTYVLNNYAYYLSQRGENLEKAEKYAKRANALKPNDRNLMDTYGWILYKQKKYEEAEVWLSRAALYEGVPNASILEHYGDALYKLNKQAEALEKWNAAREAGGNSDGLLKKILDKRLND